MFRLPLWQIWPMRTGTALPAGAGESRLIRRDFLLPDSDRDWRFRVRLDRLKGGRGGRRRQEKLFIEKVKEEKEGGGGRKEQPRRRRRRRRGTRHVAAEGLLDALRVRLPSPPPPAAVKWPHHITDSLEGFLGKLLRGKIIKRLLSLSLKIIFLPLDPLFLSLWLALCGLHLILSLSLRLFLPSSSLLRSSVRLFLPP